MTGLVAHTIRVFSKSFRTKLLSAFALLGLLPLLLGVLFMHRQAALGLERTVGRELKREAVGAIDKIDRSVSERFSDLRILARHPATSAAPAEVGAVADDFVRNYGVYDLILLADASGNVIATSTIDSSGRSLNASSLVGRSVRQETWFQEALRLQPELREVYQGDIERHSIVSDVVGERRESMVFAAPARFVEPSTGREARRVWVAFASRERLIADVMREIRTSLSAHGVDSIEVQIVDGDGLLLDDYDADAILKLNLRELGLEAVRTALSSRPGDSGFTVELHRRRQVEQLNGYAVSKGHGSYAGKGWVALVRQDREDARAAANRSLWIALVLIVGFGAAVLASAWWVASSFASPILSAAQVAKRVASGDLRVELQRTSADEIGVLQASLGELVSTLRSSFQQIAANTDSLASASTELHAVAESMTSGAARTSSQASEVADSADTTTSHMTMVATGSEELVASMKEVSRSASEVSRLASKAVDVVQRTHETLNRLGASSVQIGNVVEVINTLAEQTNLLALNATIEAARAGEAGKGFAVVANEVKELATQTASATGDIHASVNKIQADAEAAVAAIQEIHGVIEQVSHNQTSIASVVEEQTATSHEMSRGINEAASSTTQIGTSIKEVVEIARTSERAAHDTELAAASLAEAASRLQRLLAAYQF